MTNSRIRAAEAARIRDGLILNVAEAAAAFDEGLPVETASTILSSVSSLMTVSFNSQATTTSNQATTTSDQETSAQALR